MSASSSEPRPILVSACLLGLNTRYDGRTKHNQAVLDYLAAHNLVPIPVCPEQLAGLPTPREETHFTAGNGEDVLEGHGEVASKTGASMNATFCKGAEEVLKIARLTGCRVALFKERSPSCGVNQIYRGGNKVAGMGVTTALMIREGFTVFSENDLSDHETL